MAQMRVLRVIPGSIGLEPIIRSFCRQPDGYLTAYSDSALPLIRRFVTEEDSVEIRPFGEIVRLVLEMCGESAGRIAGGLESIAAIAQAVEVLPGDSPFEKSTRFPGFHEAVQRTLGELHEWEIDAQEMRRLSQETNSRLAAKLRDLAALDLEKDRILGELGRETHAWQMRNCFGAFPERDGMMERLFVLAGPEESPLRSRWLRWLADQGTEVTVVVDRHATGAPIFARADRTVQQLGTHSISPGEGTLLAQNLFREVADQSGPSLEEVSLVTASDSLAEAEAALRACADAPDSSAIFVRNLADYAPLIESASRRFRIPIRMYRRAPLLTNSLIRLTLSALEFCAGDDVRKLRTLLHSSYLGLSGIEQNRLQSALKDAHGMRSLQWDTLRMWANSAIEEFPWVLELLEWRRKALAEKLTLREWKPLLDSLIDHPEMPWHLRREGSKEGMAERDRRARNQMQRLLASHISVEALESERRLGLNEVVAYCRALMSEADVSIPSEEHGVLVTDSIEGLVDADRLHVLGMLEGVFPRRRSEDPILTDDERAEISRLRPDMPRILDSHDRAAAERDVFYRVCAAARKVLVFSYPRTDDDRDNIEAFYLSEVARALGRKELSKREIPRVEIAPPLSECRNDADRALAEAMSSERVSYGEVELAVEAAKAAIRPPQDHAYRPAELRDVLQCPFQYAFRHRLGLPSRRRSSRWQTLRKLPQAANLVSQPNRERAEAALINALESELDGLFSEVEDWELQLLRSGGRRLIRDWIRREFAARKVWPKEPESISTNVRFGEGLRDQMPFQVRLDGVVPAVSSFKNYHVAHLYQANPANAKEMTDDERLYVGLHFLALYRNGMEVAIEFDDVAGKRELVVLTREGGTAHGEAKDGLTVVDLSTSDDPGSSRKAFYEDVKALLRRAMDRIHANQITPRKDSHCDFCGYGELCRRSKDFGEEEESPFGRDIGAGLD